MLIQHYRSGCGQFPAERILFSAAIIIRYSTRGVVTVQIMNEAEDPRAREPDELRCRQ